MRLAGEGPELWHVRVDLIAPDDDGSRVGPVVEALRADLHGEDEGPELGAGVDQGIGVEGQPVLGLTFWVRAVDVGTAAATALKTARRAGSVAGVGPAYYDLSLVPRNAVVVSWEDHEVHMVD
jgi:hypothetical protein